MGRQGVAFSFVQPDQSSELSQIERLINSELEPDPLQEEIDVLRENIEPKLPPAKPKKRYRRAL